MSTPRETSKTSPRHLPIGTTLQGGKYEILQVLGQGGFGITYLAKHFIFGEVALKELFLNSGSVHCSRENTTGKQVIVHFEPQQFTKFKNRFLEEARTLHQLSAVKGVVHVRDVFEENGTAYLSMDYIRGTKLSAYVKEKHPLSESEGLQIVKSLSAIVSNVHQHNILHRDIKPDNVIIDPAGEVYLIDFGIAKQYLTEIDETHTTFHSPRYSPPEQKASKSKMGTYSDVFSLGATAYLVFTSTPPQSLEDRLLHDFIPPIQLTPSLSPEINDTICKSMELKTENRIQKASAFLAALDGLAPLAMPKKSTVENVQVPILKTPDTSEKTLVDSNLEDASTKIDQTPIDDVTKVDLAAEEKTIVHKEVTDIEATVIDDMPQEKSKRAIDWEALKAIPQTMIALFQSNRRSVLAILFLLFVVIIVLVASLGKDDPVATVQEPLEEKMINLFVTDNAGQQLPQTRIIIPSLDTSFILDDTNGLMLNVSPHWETLQNERLSVEHDGYFPETIKISTLVNDTSTQVRLVPIRISNIDLLVDNLMTYDWVNERNEKLVFNAQDTVLINYNPSGRATLHKQDALWFIERTKDSTFLVLAETMSTDNKIARFILPVSFYGPTATELTRIDLEENHSYKRKNRIGPTPPRPPIAPTVRRLDGVVVDEAGRRLAGVTIKISDPDIVTITDAEGRFDRYLTTVWDNVRNKRYEISLQSYKTQRRSVVVDESTPDLKIVLIKEPDRITLECAAIKSYWIAGNDLFFIEDCSTGTGGKAEYNGIAGRWFQMDRMEPIYIRFDSHEGSRSERFLVQNPTNAGTIGLNKQGLQFSKITAEAIFFKKITGTWKYYKNNNPNKEITLSIQNCSLSNGKISATITHDGDDATPHSSRIDIKRANVELGFIAAGVNYIIHIDNPLILKDQNLTIRKQQEKTAYQLKKSN